LLFQRLLKRSNIHGNLTPILSFFPFFLRLNLYPNVLKLLRMLVRI
jgi:hypothetical protein